MRIRVSVDITKPLCRGRRAQLEKNKEIWISFKYERLPNFCYWFGLLTHSDKDCPYWLRNQASLRVEDQQFGAWLRASNDRPWRKTEIKVAGILRQPTPKNFHHPHPSSPQPTPHQPPPSHPSSHNNPIRIIPPHMISSSTLHRTTPLPPGNTKTSTLPHSPTIYPPPITTIFPPPNSTTSPPPLVSIPTQTHAPTQEDHAVHMEMEENLICTPLPSQPVRQEDHFKSQLRDIDAVLNYHPPTAKSIMKLLERENVSKSQGTHTVLGDITNMTQPKVREPKVQSAKKSWKKLARTPGNFADTPLDPIHVKRSSYSLNDSNDSNQFSKKHCGVVNDIISAEAMGQPRREP